MKLNLTANRRGNQSVLRAVLDFFFPVTERIRLESASRVKFNPQGIYQIDYEFGTFRAFIAHIAGMIRKQAESFAGTLGVEPRFAFNLGAIAFDATANSGDKAAATPWSWNHTATGSNLVMVMDILWWDNAGAITINTPTYNSVNMTLGLHKDVGGDVDNCDIWYLASPATGTNSASVSFSAGSYGEAGTQTFSGANTSSPQDATASGTGTATSGSVSITTNNANSFIVDCLAAVGGGVPAVSGSQTANWTDGTRGGGSARLATTTAGSYSMGWTWDGVSRNWAIAVFAVNEAVATSTVKQLAALGAG